MVFGCILVGFIAKRFGRKWPLIFLAIPSLISWLAIYFASNVYYLYVARVIQGFVVAGTFSFGHLYLVEISSDRWEKADTFCLVFRQFPFFFSLRGTITSTLMLSANTGILVAFAISFLGYSASPVFAITTTIIFVILFVMFPETPLFLVKQNKISVNFISNSNKYKA